MKRSPRSVVSSLLLVLAFSLGSAVAGAQEEMRFRDGRFLEILGGVTIQRADERGADEAVRNMPFLPGDRVWTDERGRAEIVFAEGEILWVAERSKVDSLGRGGREQDERLALRVFAGSFSARVREGGPGFEFHAPGGTILSTGAASFRVDVRAGETTLSVSSGEVLADLAGRKTAVRAGQRVRYAQDELDGPFRFARADEDGFDRWTRDRTLDLESLARRSEYLPDELEDYSGELEDHGEWVYDEPQGYVYVPRVAATWAPYSYGRWIYTAYGWTWVADEPWGFVTSHYGRWGYSSRLGWHWMPRAGFAGAWVAWASPMGAWSHTIGWCALGYNDRPVHAYGSGGRAVPRGSVAGDARRGWTFANRAELGSSGALRRRTDVPDSEVQRAAIWNADSAPDRDFRQRTRRTTWRETGGEGAGVQRAVERATAGGRGDSERGTRINVRPTAGDSTPELRADPMTTIPNPESRRQRAIGQDGYKEEQDNRRGRSGDDYGFVVGGGSGPARSEHGRANEGGGSSRDASEPRGSERTEGARSDGSTGQPTRDPLLSRFLRSINGKSSRDADGESARGNAGGAERSGRDSAGDDRRSNDSGRVRPAAPREEPRSRDAARPTPSRPSGGSDRERARPSGNDERAQPRGGSSGSQGGEGSRRRPNN